MSKRIAILHPDLGIGGAEQLIINVALSLMQRGYDVTIYTPFFDPNRCLEEAKLCRVEVRGSWFPASICGRFKALCAYIRMVLCALWVVFFAGAFGFYILDQVSLPVPILRCRNRNVLFYCHFPDKLLQTNRSSLVMKIYRFFLDNLEEITTGMAQTTLVNSKFTQDIFLANFPLIRKYQPAKVPQILYPAINPKNFEISQDFNASIEELLGREDMFSGGESTLVITSLNRYERKKNVNLALETFARYLQMKGSHQKAVLVVAGGYDERLLENVEHHLELVNLANKLQIMDKVVFLRSISNDQRVLLLQNTNMLLYTPANEHFGIVPVEAMHLGCIVLACDSGGPLESIDHGTTGFTLSPKATLWAEQIHKLYSRVAAGGEGESELLDREEGADATEEREKIIESGRQRVKHMFSEQAFGDRLQEVLEAMRDNQHLPSGPSKKKLQ